MQTVQFKVTDDYLKNILKVLNNFKKGVVKDIAVIKPNSISEAEKLQQLFAQSNNKIKATMRHAIDTRDMTDDIS